MILRSYASPLRATAAAEFLRRNGIEAHVAYRLDASGIFGAQGSGVHDVLLEGRDSNPRAQRLAWFFDHSLPRLDPQWEEQTAPDLSRLDPRSRPACPGCGMRLSPASVKNACPACREPVNLTDLIVAQHGPEALAACYPEAVETPEFSEFDEAELEAMLAETVQHVHLRCPACDYDLVGLEVEGVCPECGGGYSKVALISG